MKTTKQYIQLSLMLLGICMGSVYAGEQSSLNGFEAPQCTWGVDMLTYSFGWELDFSQAWGRDARLWPELLENGGSTSRPNRGDILVLDGWDQNSYGHVAWVWYVEQDTQSGYGGYYTLVIHTNWRAGSDLFEYQNTMFRYSWFYFCRDWDDVYCFDSKKWYPLAAILREQ